MMRILTVLLVVLAACAACSKKDEPKPAEKKAEPKQVEKPKPTGGKGGHATMGQAVVDMMTQRATIKGGHEAGQKIRKISAERDKDLEEVLP